MAEYAVQNNPYSQRPGVLAELSKLLLRSQQRINFFIIARIVTMVAFRFKDRIQINDRNAQIA